MRIALVVALTISLAASAAAMAQSRPNLDFGQPVVADPSPQYHQTLRCAFAAGLGKVLYSDNGMDGAAELDILRREALLQLPRSNPTRAVSEPAANLIEQKIAEVFRWAAGLPEANRGAALLAVIDENLPHCDAVMARIPR